MALIMVAVLLHPVKMMLLHGKLAAEPADVMLCRPLFGHPLLVRPAASSGHSVAAQLAHTKYQGWYVELGREERREGGRGEGRGEGRERRGEKREEKGEKRRREKCEMLISWVPGVGGGGMRGEEREERGEASREESGEASMLA